MNTATPTGWFLLNGPREQFGPFATQAQAIEAMRDLKSRIDMADQFVVDGPSDAIVCAKGDPEIWTAAQFWEVGEIPGTDRRHVHNRAS